MLSNNTYVLGNCKAAIMCAKWLPITALDRQSDDKKCETMLYLKYVKRIIDIICSALALTVFSWLYLALAIAVRINLGSPILFKQNRVGKGERLFQLCKFRSMTDERDTEGKLLPDAQRITPFGRFLRASSLDELPEVINILKGDMSIVGPRPWGPTYLPYYTETERHRHDVRPGLTGLAQINGRSAATWDARIRHDLEYVENVSFLNDLKIFFLTFRKVIMKEDVADAEVRGNFDDYRRKQWELGIVERPELNVKTL